MSCFSCQKPLSGDLAPHLCAACGAPQPVDALIDPFTVFGLEPRFSVDREEVRRRFFALSRALHPDRFAEQRGEFLENSLERMSLLNQAYRALTDPAGIRASVLARYGVSAAPSGGSRLPTEFAEEWFEIQEQRMDDPASALKRAEVLLARLTAERAEEASAVAALEQEFDASASSASGVAILNRISERLGGGGYRDSLERDIRRAFGSDLSSGKKA